MDAAERAAAEREFLKDNEGLAAALAALGSPLLRPTIVIQDGLQPWIINATETILIEKSSKLQLFKRGVEMVRVVILTDEDKRDDVLKRPTGTVQLMPVSMPYLKNTLNQLINFQKILKTGKAKDINCPDDLVQIYLSGAGEWRLSELTGFIEAPIMRRDGSILSTTGYDTSTGLFLVDGQWPVIPDSPTREDALKALAVLSWPFSQFPFIDGANKSVLIAAILTAIQRRLLQFAPLFGFSAPQPRSGKSLLAESIAIIAQGRKSAAMAVATDGNEFRKAIAAALHEGQAIVNLDNLEYPLGSPDLCRALTQEIYSDRQLGVTHNLLLPTNMLWTATGNNLTFKGDLSSRTLLCQIDAETARPEERTFRIDLTAYLLANRMQLLGAALTMLKAYQKAGRSRQDVKPWGGFDDWSRTIRELLVWLGCDDPCETREQIIVDDPDRELDVAVLSALNDAFNDKKDGVLVSEIINEAATNEVLKVQLLMVAAQRTDSKSIDPRRLGNWCRKVEGRFYDDLRLVRGKTQQRATMWRITSKADKAPRVALVKKKRSFSR